MKSRIICLDIILITALFSLDFYNPSLPAMMTDIGVSYAMMRAISIFFFVGIAISQGISGPASEIHGRKKVILIALSLLCFSNLLTTIAHNIIEIFIFRLMAGFGAGGCLVCIRAVLCDISESKSELMHSLAMMVILSQLSPAFAPVLGGLIQQFYTWRINFLLLFLLTASVFFISLFLFKESYEKRKINIRKIIHGYGTALKNKIFILYSVLSGISYSFFIGYCTISPYIYQKILHISPLKNGLSYLITFVGLGSGAYVVNKIAFDSNRLLLTIAIAYSVLFVGMIFIGYFYLSFLIMLLFGILVSFMCGFSAPPLAFYALLQIKDNNPGIGTAMQGIIKMFSTGIFLALFLQIHISNLFQFSYVFFIASIFFLLISLLLIYFSNNHRVKMENRI